MFRVLFTQNLTPAKWKILNKSRRHNDVVFNKSLDNRTYHSLIPNRNNAQERRLLAVPSPVAAVQAQQSASHSTHPNAKMMRLLERRMKKIRTKKYAELLQVQDTGVKATQTVVKKLKNEKLTNFVSNRPATTSTKIHRPTLTSLQDTNDNIPIIFVSAQRKDLLEGRIDPETALQILTSYHNHKELLLAEEEVVEHGEAIEEGIEIQKKVAKKDKPYRSNVHKTAHEEAMAKRFCITSNLTSYLDLCVARGMPNRGTSTVLSYRQKYKKISSTFLGIELYNILLQGFAELGEITRMKDILGVLKSDEVPLNAQSYASILDCMGRLYPGDGSKGEIPESDMAFLRLQLTLATEQGITLNDIVTKSIFVRDQYDVVLSVATRIEPDFRPVFESPNIFYDNPLLVNLNETVLKPGSSSDPVFQAVPKTTTSKSPLTKQELQTMSQVQLEQEMIGYVTVKSIEKFPPLTDQVIAMRKKLADLQDIWKAQICAAFKRDLKSLAAEANAKGTLNINLLPYLMALEPNQYAEILLRELRKLAEGSETFSPTVSQLYRQLGKTVELRYHVEQRRHNGIQAKTLDIYEEFLEYSVLAKNPECFDNNRQIWQKLVHRVRDKGATFNWNETPWPQHVTTGVGRFLYNILMRDLKIDVNVLKPPGKRTNQFSPAFYTIFRNQARIVKEEVKPHPILVRLFRESQQEHLTFATNLVPMLCPPQPWTSPIHGGYLVTKSDLVRLPQHANQQLKRIHDTPLQCLYPSLDSLNQLAAVPWVVNQQILDVILQVFQTNGSDELDVPRPPTTLLRPSPGGDKERNELTGSEKLQLFREKMSYNQKQAEMYSLWCDCLYRLSLANHFRDKVFWLPHNMDFRGRVYPLPPHLNHLGSDLARSMLLFHERRPLGPDGFQWLKLHCINLTGLKKRDSVADRLAYADEVFDQILDSADNPLTGKRWWAASDEPWQTLACCMEIAKVHRSEDKPNYLSNFPIHQDGSCNGLQHYAALGRDTAGAHSVNLAPAPVPQDVYSAVATLVDEMRAKDAELNVEIAKVLAGFVRRKVIKQTVMTTVYGVTRYGARLQIAKQLKAIDDFPGQYVWPASTYLTTKTFESLREMFTSTKEIQDWFTDCAKLISSVCCQNVEWITPLGLPVVQPYSRPHAQKALPKSNAVPDWFAVDTFERPNIVKQKNAFPPNFIHSLDSSHMMLTSLHCERGKMTFISVHDCFWTHPATVDTMNRITREQFVALHSQPILEDLSDFLQSKYRFPEREIEQDGSMEEAAKRKLNLILGKLPEKGDFDLSNVLQSIYFFS